MAYDVGDRIRIRATFTDLDDNPADPTAVTLQVRNPAGTVTTPTAINDPGVVGGFYHDLDLDQPGVWTYRFSGTGAIVAADEATLVVEESTFPATAFAGVVSVPRYRTITGDITTTDAAVTGALVDAQGLVEEYLRRWLTLEEHTETLRLIDGRVYPKGYPIASAGTLTVERTRSILGAPISEPIWNVPLTGDSWATVTYTGGYTALTLPKTIEREIARTAFNVLHPSKIPAGALSVTQGDASVTFGKASSNGELDAVSRRALRPWRNDLP